MVAKRNDYHLTTLQRLAKSTGRLLFWLGRPLYLLIILTIVLTILLLYYIGKITVTLIHSRPQRLPTIAFPRLPKVHISLKKTLIVLLLLVGGSAAGAFWFWNSILRDLPSPTDLTTRPQPLSTHILDRNGQLLYKIYRNENRTTLPLEDIPLHVQQATIAIEDAEFYAHPGFSVRGILRAIQHNIATRELTGGSTITQQLVKNVLLTHNKTLRRKIKEVILAFMTEMQFSKKEILSLYLNEVSYGGASYGIEEAAQVYFGKSARDLTLGEGALLAGLPAAPTRYSPFGATPEHAKERQRAVLSRMAQERFITQEQVAEVGEHELVFAPQQKAIRAPHFVMYIKQLLVDTYGERLVEEGGLTVVTSLDLTLQEAVEQIVQEEVAKLTPLHVTNGAALITSPATGEILAMIGSVNYFDQTHDGNFNVTTALRQPGSSIKPVNYAWALSHGYTPATILEDTPITYNVPGQPPYSPENYDQKFRGKLPLRTALGSSLNVPAVKVLASYGVNNMIEQGRKMGITTWEDPSRFGLSLTLGGGEVKMTDMAIAYGILANYGKRVALSPILRVTRSNGEVLQESFCCQEEQVVDPRVAFLLTHILTDNKARTLAFGANSLLIVPGHAEVAVKTGTTQNLRDNWADGYTKDYVVITWVGNNDNTPMSRIASGVTGATPIWHRTMRFLLQTKQNHSWDVPKGVVKVPICPVTGTLSCQGCPVVEEYFLEENQPKNRCTFAQPTPTPTITPQTSIPTEELSRGYFY